MAYVRMEGDQGPVDIANANLANNNMEIIRKLNAILDDQIEVSNLANIVQQQNKGQSSTLNTNAEAFYPNTTGMYQNANYIPSNGQYHTQMMSNQTGHTVMNNQELIAGLQKLGNLNNVNWAAIQQAVNASKHAQSQAGTTNTSDPSSFIPGAISNRTLEHLTESMTRPARAIKGSTDNNQPCPPTDHRTPLPATNVGTIGDSRPSSTSPPSNNSSSMSPIDLSTNHRSTNALSALNNSLMGMSSGAMTSPGSSIHVKPSSTPGGGSMASSGAPVMNMSMTRSCTPESDTSGVSSGGTSDISDVALIDLMYNLNLGKLNAHTQTTPTVASNNANTSSLVQQLAALTQQQQQQHSNSSQPQQQPQTSIAHSYPMNTQTNSVANNYSAVSQQMAQQGYSAPQAAGPLTPSCAQQYAAVSSQQFQPQQQHQASQQSAQQYQPTAYQGASGVYVYQQPQQPVYSSHQMPNYQQQQQASINNSLVPYLQAIHVDSYSGTHTPAGMVSPYVIQPMQEPMTSHQSQAAISNGYSSLVPYNSACELAVQPTNAYPSQLTPQQMQPVHQVAPANFAMNMDLVTEKSVKNQSLSLSALLGQSHGAGFQQIAPPIPPTTDQAGIEKAAKWYRNAASVYEATCTWSGQLPPKIYKNPVYSCKVFLGGVPWDITESGLQAAFKAFGPTRIEWPQEGKHKIRNPMKAGYVYVLFETDKAVKALLQACTHDFSNGGEYYYKISSRRMRCKEVQVIPWVLSDSNYVKQPSQRLDPTKTVFVGALHGMMNAEGLAQIMNDLFGNVVYAGIDTDKHKYPIGSGRVTFSSHKSFMKAVNAAFVEVKTPKFTKKVQIDPYLEDAICTACGCQAGPYFCRDLACFRYYCRNCWQFFHDNEATRHHKPLMRNHVRANAEV